MEDTKNIFFDGDTNFFDIFTAGRKGGSKSVSAYLSMRREAMLRAVSQVKIDDDSRVQAETAARAYIEAQDIIAVLTARMKSDAAG
ncbi:hypothetical protein [uncultured Tateyamaria sp.]|uniref:hypothetical protein n=1 Tax=uncultured Tateyamaria sp. TaxID=455651 RepID=UPI002607FE33|nr:hypothetical protein [uncultured Tateyamaria sp.]